MNACFRKIFLPLIPSEKYRSSFLFFVWVLMFMSCKEVSSGQAAPESEKHPERYRSEENPADKNTFSEDFETGKKASYAKENIMLHSGLWELDDALLGNSGKDVKNGKASLRIKESGSAVMLFDMEDSVSTLSFACGLFGNDPQGTLTVSMSENQGKDWKQLESRRVVSGRFEESRIPVYKKGPVRFKFLNQKGGRINLDDIIFSESRELKKTTSSTGENLIWGNPSKAEKSLSSPNNFLIEKPQFALSYNSAAGIPNWVSWHLSRAWKGDASRCNCFAGDEELPGDFFTALSSHYTGTGFDRGHLCPSEDRDRSEQDNAATFKMTNIIPQSPDLNQGPWKDLEDYCRKLINQGKELYIIAGVYGEGGENSRNEMVQAIGKGKIRVPSNSWKIVMVLPEGDRDLERIQKNTRVIAVDMPNRQNLKGKPWTDFLTRVSEIEQATGLEFFTELNPEIRKALKSKTDKAKEQ